MTNLLMCLKSKNALFIMYKFNGIANEWATSVPKSVLGFVLDKVFNSDLELNFLNNVP